MEQFFPGEPLQLSGGVDPDEPVGRFLVFADEEEVETTDDEQEAVAFADAYARWLLPSQEAVVMHYGIVHYRASGFAKVALCD